MQDSHRFEIMNENESGRTISYDVQRIRERAARQREAFKRTHGCDPVSGKAAHSLNGYADDQFMENPGGYHYSYQPGYADPSRKPYPEVREKGSSMPVISLILGIISIIFFWTMPLAMLIALAGIIMSIHVIGKKNEKGLGTAALITSIIGMILALILTGFVIMNSEKILRAFNEINNAIAEEYGEDFEGNPFGHVQGLSFQESQKEKTT